MLKNIHFVVIVLILLLFSCGEKRTKIFSLDFRNLEFEVPVGFAGGGAAMFFEFPELMTEFEAQLQANGVDMASIGGIFPLEAQVRSFDGSEYYFIRDIAIRVCDATKPDCEIELDDVFYVLSLNGQANDRVDLLSGLQNVKDLMSSESFRLEVVMTLNPGQITPSRIRSFLDMTFEVVE